MICRGKERFTDFARAKRVAKYASAHNDTPMAPYACKDCGGFHIGGSARVKQKARARRRKQLEVGP